MARVNTYLNFAGHTEKAFEFYRSVFGGEFIGGINRFKDAPSDPNQPMPPGIENMVMHVALETLGGHQLMGTDAPKEMGFSVTEGNNVYISLEPDSKAEADRLFNALAVNGMPIQDMFWGAYFGSLTDQWGVHWMVNFPAPQA